MKDLDNETVLQKFQKFKAMFVSTTNVPANLLLEMAENFITANDDNAVEDIPVLDGQLSLFDMSMTKELKSL